MKLINYYYSYLTEINGNKPLDLSGILLTPTLVDNKIIWFMENPNNESYSKYGIEGFVDDLLMDFSNKTAGEFYDKLYRKQSINIEKELYLTEEFKNKLLNLAQKKTKFDFFGKRLQTCKNNKYKIKKNKTQIQTKDIC